MNAKTINNASWSINDSPLDKRTAVHVFAAAILVSFFLLAVLGQFPGLVLFCIDLMFCLFCCFCFRSKLQFLFLLHPFLVVFTGQFYEVDFLDLGDGIAYYGTIRNLIPYYGGSLDALGLIEESSLFAVLKYANFGVLPIYLIPDFFFDAPSSGVYFQWQIAFHVVLVSVCLTLSMVWDVMPRKYLFALTLFSVISPTFFEFYAAPTRHAVTFASLWMFYLSFVATVAKPNAAKISLLIFSIVLVTMSKMPYLIMLILFVMYYFVFESKVASAISRALMFAMVCIGGAFLLFPFYEIYAGYEEVSATGASTFGWILQLPIINILGKYAYALLAPFPWQLAIEHADSIYGGNFIHFIMHVGSSLFGIYFLCVLILHASRLFRSEPEMRPILVYGIIFSLTLLRGATGFHTYLSIFFPFFAPVLTVARFRLSPFIPIAIAFGCEMAYSLLTLGIEIG